MSQRDNIIAQKFNQIAQKQSELAQKDNQLSIKIATSTKKDSIAMMTFTFITALFLPGTYVSTLLSVTLIDWQANSAPAVGNSRQDRVQVSRYYWVYWAITIPLTGLVMLGWYVWYVYANKMWLREAELELKGKESRGEF